MTIEALIAQGESETLEFKSSLQWDVKKGCRNEGLRLAVLKTIAAFLNGKGGWLVIGVADDGQIIGLEKDLALVGHSRDRFAQTVDNLIAHQLGPQYTPLIERRFAEVGGRTVYVVEVRPASQPVYLKGSEFYVRLQTTTRQLNPKETFEYIGQHWPGLGPSVHAQPSEPSGAAMNKAFHTVAIPHDDILEGRLTLDVFAADLWEVYHHRGPEEYRDADLFFEKTYLTAGLRHLLEVVQKRLAGEGGDPVVQLQTPFGGGKTHALIALYHKAREWQASTVVISGTPLSGDKTLWGLMAEQLSGGRAGFEAPTAPGRDALRALLAERQPVLILMDELLEYIVKAGGVAVGASTLAAQTLAFMQELTEAVSTLERAVLVVALPSSTLEHYDEQAALLFEQLKKISGRVERVFTPVQDNEVGAVIRRRLFAKVDEKAAARVVNGFVDVAVQETVTATGEESATYRERFKETYPFLPEVVEVLYHRWGSFPTFQRTRGTLRLLALVVHALKDRHLPYIALGDFDLGNADIRRELLKHIGNEYDSVIAADITDANAGAVKVNREIGKSYQGLQLGERVATTIFMYSHLGGGGEAGATLNEIKRQNLSADAPASVVAEVVQKLTSQLLFYLHEHGGRYYFTTTPNLNRALTIRMENLSQEQIERAERAALGQQAGGQTMKTFLWPTNTADIADDEAPKLLILREADELRMMEFLRNKGQSPRVHRNTLFFLTPLPAVRVPFEKLLRRQLAISDLKQQRTLALTPEQRDTLERESRQTEQDLQDQIGHLYRQLYLPTADGLTSVDLGIPTYGANQKLDTRVYERLRAEGRLIERLAPLVIKERYLGSRDYVETRQLADSSSRTPGEVLVASRQVWEKSIAEGVRQGLFGLGELDDQGQSRCLYFGSEPTVSLAGREVLIRAEVCQAEPGGEPGQPAYPPRLVSGKRIAEPGSNGTYPPVSPLVSTGETYTQLSLRFEVPRGKVSSLMGLLNYLQTKFARLEMALHLDQGALSEQEMEEKVREAFRQMGIRASEPDGGLSADEAQRSD